MAPVVLIIFIVLVPLAIGICIAYVGYQRYKGLRFPAPDVEQTRQLGSTPHGQWQEVEINDITQPENQYHSGQWYGSPAVVHADIAPVAKPLPSSPYLEYTGGEGLVSLPRCVAVSIEEEKEGNEATGREINRFDEQNTHGGEPWDFEKGGYGSSATQQLEIQCPKPVRAIIENKPKVKSAMTAYDAAQTAASDIWDRIDKGEVSVSRRKPERKVGKPLFSDGPRGSATLDGSDMVDGDRNITKSRASIEYPASPVESVQNRRTSIDSLATVVDTNNVNIRRSSSYIKRKASIDHATAAAPTRESDRAAEARYKMSQAQKQRATRQKQEGKAQLREEEEEEEEEEEGERRNAQERGEHEKKHVGPFQQRERENGDQIPALKPKLESSAKNIPDKNGVQPRVHSSRRGSNTCMRHDSTTSHSKLSHIPQELPVRRRSKRANSIAANVPKADSPRSSLLPNPPRSMSMTEQTRPDLGARMPSIIERVRPNSHGSGGWSKEPAKRNKEVNRRSGSSAYSAGYNDARSASQTAEFVQDCYDSRGENRRDMAGVEKRIKSSKSKRSSSSSWLSAPRASRPSSANGSSTEPEQRDGRLSTGSRSSVSNSVTYGGGGELGRRASVTLRNLSEFEKTASGREVVESKRRKFAAKPEEAGKSTLEIYSGQSGIGDEVACETESEDEGNKGHGDGSESSGKGHGPKTPRLRGGAQSLTGETNTDNETDSDDDAHAGYTQDRHSGDERMYTAHSQDSSVSNHAGEENSANEYRGYERSKGHNSDEEYPDRPRRDEHSDHEREHGDYEENSHSESDSDSSSA